MVRAGALVIGWAAVTVGLGYLVLRAGRAIERDQVRGERPVRRPDGEAATDEFVLRHGAAS